jgi:hypothetical protein
MEWVAVVFVIIGLLLNINRRWEGFVFWLFSNAYWFHWNAEAGQWPQAIVFGIFCVMSLCGVVVSYKETRNGKEAGK